MLESYIKTKLEEVSMIDLNDLDVSNLVKLYDYDLFTLGAMADKIRRDFHGKKVCFNINRHINPSNICADICKFCAFSAHRKNPNPYEMTKDEILSDVASAYNRSAREMHIVSAHNPNYSYEWYFDIFKTIKSKFPDIHIKAMTAAEVDFLHRKFNKSYEEILKDMMDSGVDSMPGGGAEIFNEEIRAKICKGKVSSKDWLKIHSIWHSMGFRSNATMLFGHIEKREHRIEHILLIRELQEQSGGFNAFIPILYQRQNNFLDINDYPSGIEILKTIAISRILLTNVPNIKAYWATLGLNLALVAQEFGANDVDGTIEQENIQSAAGANSKKGLSKDELISQIKDAGFIPILRDSMYNELKVC